MIYIPNNRIACVPPESLSIEKQGKTFMTVKEKTALFPLKVVYPGLVGPYQSGDTVFVRGDCKTAIWMKEEFTLAGAEVILVPLDQIQAVDTGKGYR